MESRRVESYQDLVVWQKSHEIVRGLYEITAKFPKREHLALAQQIREIASQVPINIAVGFNRRGRKNKIHYYRTALLSIENMRYFVLLSKDLGHMKKTEELEENCDTVERMLKRLIRSVATPRT